MLANQTEAPRFRRAVAWVFDVLVAMAVMFAGFAALAQVCPPDRPGPYLIDLVITLMLGVGYLLLAAPVFGNTLGKKLFSLRAVNVDPDAPMSFARWLVRASLTTILWPINAFMILFVDDRHLGDRVGNTRVVLQMPSRNLFVACALVVVGGFLLFQGAILSLRVAVLRTDVWAAAKGAVKGDTSWLPAAFATHNREALFYVESGGDFHKVWLARPENTWNVVSVEKVTQDAVPNSASMSFSISDPEAARASVEDSIAKLMAEEAGLKEVRVVCPARPLVGNFECEVTIDEGTRLSVPVTRTGEDLALKHLAIGKKLAPIIEQLAEERIGAPLEGTQCPAVARINGVKPVVCTTSFNGVKLEMNVVLTSDSKIDSLSIPDLMEASQLEEKAKGLLLESGQPALEFRCPKRAYARTAQTEIVCPATNGAANAVFTIEGDEVSVNIR